MARPRKLTKKLENTILELIADGKTIRETFANPRDGPVEELSDPKEGEE